MDVDNILAASSSQTRPSDACRYSIYIPVESQTDTAPASDDEVNVAGPSRPSRHSLQGKDAESSSPSSTDHAFAASIMAFADELCADHRAEGQYIWQRQPFAVRPGPMIESSSTPVKLSPKAAGKQRQRWMHLQGSTETGESVEDEWFIVHLLFEISKKWPQASIEVEDVDGQFLLIEAADALPRWVTPQNAMNRVWVRRGRIHLIPLENISNNPQTSAIDRDTHDAGFLTIPDALTLLEDAYQNKTLQATEQIQRIIEKRVADTLHAPHAYFAVAILPTTIAQAIAGDPSLVSDAVAAFYERDAVQLRKYAQWMKKFSPSSSTRAKVKLTRALYAQLRSQRFYPPRVFERAGWRVAGSVAEEGSPDEKAVDIGVKLAVGFEIRYGETAMSRAPESGSQDASNYTRSAEYLRFIVALSKNNYFCGEIPGSKLYTDLEVKAAEYWKSSSAIVTRDDSFAARVDTAISASKAKPQSGPSSAQDLIADDDAWLCLDQDDLERMLSDRTSGGKRPERTEEGLTQDTPPKIAELVDEEDEDEKLANEQAKRLQSMAEQFETFVEGEGSMDGALLDDELSDEESSDGEMEDDREVDETHYTTRADIVAGPATSKSASKKRKLDNLVAPLPAVQWGAAAAAATPKKGVKVHSGTCSTPVTDLDTQRLKPRMAEEIYDGASDLSDDDDGGDDPNRFLEGSDEEEDGPQVVRSEDEIAFGVSEMDEFLDFARTALGLSKDQYAAIVQSRIKAGKNVPGSQRPKDQSTLTNRKPSPVSTSNDSQNRVDDSSAKASMPPPQAQATMRNPRLDSFETLMTAMDTELQRARTQAVPSISAVAMPEDAGGSDSDSDIDAMEAQLQRALKGGKDDHQSEESVNYGMVKNFLESFKAQSGTAGPVSNMFGRLDSDFKMPADR